MTDPIIHDDNSLEAFIFESIANIKPPRLEMKTNFGQISIEKIRNDKFMFILLKNASISDEELLHDMINISNIICKFANTQIRIGYFNSNSFSYVVNAQLTNVFREGKASSNIDRWCKDCLNWLKTLSTNRICFYLRHLAGKDRVDITLSSITPSFEKEIEKLIIENTRIYPKIGGIVTIHDSNIPKDFILKFNRGDSITFEMELSGGLDLDKSFCNITEKICKSICKILNTILLLDIKVDYVENTYKVGEDIIKMTLFDELELKEGKPEKDIHKWCEGFFSRIRGVGKIISSVIFTFPKTLNGMMKYTKNYAIPEYHELIDHGVPTEDDNIILEGEIKQEINDTKESVDDFKDDFEDKFEEWLKEKHQHKREEKEETKEIRDEESKVKETECPICMKNKVRVTFGCGHLTCYQCSTKIKECPKCRKIITKRIIVYL